MRALPKNTREPTDCKGGWFYIDDAAIEVVTHNGNICRVTRQQLLAALKLMRKRRTSDRGAAK